jgi:hypothetical protein
VAIGDQRLLAYTVTRFRAAEVMSANAAMVADAFERHGVDYFFLNAHVQQRRELVVAREHRAAALTALATELAGTATYVSEQCVRRDLSSCQPNNRQPC